MAALLAEYGLHMVADDALLTVAHTLGDQGPSRASLRSGRVAVAESR
jgi:hypothetical protein